MTFIIFALSIGLTALGFVIELKEGLLSRVYVAGARPVEVILAMLLTQIVILSMQILFMLIFALLVFNLPLAGNLFFAIVFMMSLGLLGMTYGIFISTMVSTEIDAVQFAVGTFFPVLLLSGVLWPVESVPVPLIYLSKALPTTWGGNAMRSVLIRGWGFDNDQVRFLSFSFLLSNIMLE
jgi:ABC-type multidrug transport system permease subunit